MTEAFSPDIVPRPVRLRVEDYLLLDDAGALDAYSKTELIDGEIVFMNAQHRPHARIKSRLYLAISERLRDLGGRLEAIVEGSVAMPPDNVPEPDIVVTSAAEGEGLIPLDSVVLVVEVADATLANDLGPKQAIYARHGVPEYWVVDVKERAIHQIWGPAGDRYSGQRQIRFGEAVASVAVEGLAVSTADL